MNRRQFFKTAIATGIAGPILLTKVEAAHPLEYEEGVFEEYREQWLRYFPSKYAVIQDDDWCVGFETWEEALRTGCTSFGINRPFLVRQILAVDRAYFIGYGG